MHRRSSNGLSLASSTNKNIIWGYCWNKWLIPFLDYNTTLYFTVIYVKKKIPDKKSLKMHFFLSPAFIWVILINYLINLVKSSRCRKISNYLLNMSCVNLNLNCLWLKTRTLIQSASQIFDKGCHQNKTKSDRTSLVYGQVWFCLKYIEISKCFRRLEQCPNFS